LLKITLFLNELEGIFKRGGTCPPLKGGVKGMWKGKGGRDICLILRFLLIFVKFNKKEKRKNKKHTRIKKIGKAE